MDVIPKAAEAVATSTDRNMRKPSRAMPPSSSGPLGILGIILLLSFLAVILALVFFYPWLLIVVGGVVVLTVISNARLRNRLQRISGSRQRESICSFARTFDCRTVDTWIIRATYEELQHYHRGYVRRFPFRATDRIEEELELDPEDLDDLARDIAHRAGRSMKEVHGNPLYGKVKTVRDIVEFLMHQPKIADRDVKIEE